ncbi:biotin/lipoyl-binding protein [bacterium]|nr:biotin/lipoyl-binding protein [bacterium]
MKFVLVLVMVFTLGFLIRGYYDELEVIPPGTIRGNGIIEATEVEVSSKIPGRVMFIEAQEGDEVFPGQVIATLEEHDLKR